MAYLAGVIALILITALIYLLFLGVRTPKEVHCPKDVWTTVISNFGTGMPAFWRLQITSADNTPVTGEFEEQKYTLVFPQPPNHGELTSNMNFQRDWINAIYRLKVKPTSDVTIKFNP